MNTKPFQDDRVAEVERLTLGGYIQGAPIDPRINEFCFYTTANKICFAQIKRLKSQSLELDVKIVCVALEKQGLLDHAGGADHVAHLVDGASSVNTAYYEQQLLDAAMKRTAWAAHAEAKEHLEKGDDLAGVEAVFNASLSKIEKAKAKSADNEPILFAELMKKNFPPKEYFIQNILSPGLTVLSGPSKMGKSWLALQLTAALDNGGFFLGSLKAEKVTALYFSLEDGQEAIFHRLEKQGGMS
jgi:replicative DNA helicase